MKTVKFTIAMLAAGLLTSTASAQTTPPAPATPAPSATAAPAVPAMAQLQTGQWLGSKMKGLDVYNAGGEKVGDITDLIMAKDGKIEAIIIGVGGFLGIGQHDVAVPFAEVKFSDDPRPNTLASTAPATNPPAAAPRTEPTTTGTTTARVDAAHRGYPDHAVVNMTRDQLKAAPQFKTSR